MRIKQQLNLNAKQISQITLHILNLGRFKISRKFRINSYAKHYTNANLKLPNIYNVLTESFSLADVKN